MNENQIQLSSLAMDLKRVALSYHRGSNRAAKRFSEEALKRKDEVDELNVKPYIRKLMEALPKMLAQKDKKIIAEDALMYSTLFQNYVLTYPDNSSAAH